MMAIKREIYCNNRNAHRVQYRQLNIYTTFYAPNIKYEAHSVL